MAQLNIYVPDDTAEALRQQARAAGIPLSRLVLSRMAVPEANRDWPAGFFLQTCGFLTEDLIEPPDPLPGPVAVLDPQ
jgi:hypothetical protein